MADSKISQLVTQSTLHDADLGVSVDTTDTTQAATGTTKKWTWTTIKAFLKTYFDTLYLGLHATSDTATKLAATKMINGTAFDGSADIVNNFPEGFLINGKFTVIQYTGGHLTVELFTLADATPSIADPVYVRIGNTIRAITSRTICQTGAAGTNYFNAGSTELATQEIDYFVYLGYNTTDGVTMGISRIPYAKMYSDFSHTATNEKYGHLCYYNGSVVSADTHAVSTDVYENIGRFAATLSAGAGYTWSVPTFTSSNLIQRPIYETRFLSWTPTITYAGGSTNPTSNNITNIKYKIVSDSVFFNIVFTIVKGAGDRTYIGFSLPLTSSNTKVANSAYVEYGSIYQMITYIEPSNTYILCTMTSDGLGVSTGTYYLN